MSYQQIEEVINYLDSIKKKNPEHIKFARLHLMCVKEVIGAEGIKNAKIHYQAKIAVTPIGSNFIAINAITISLILVMTTKLFETKSVWVDLFCICIIFAVLACAGIMIRSNAKQAQKIVSHTILVELLEEISESN